MTFEAENDLERALMRAPSDPSARPEFYRLLLESELFIVGQLGDQTPELGEVTAKNGDRLMIATVEYQGRNYHPVFTALSRLKNFVQDEVQYLSMQGRRLFEATRGADFLLNPGADFGKELPAAEIASIMGSTRVMIGQPSVYPHALIDGLKDVFARDPGVIAAYLVQVSFDTPDDKPHPMIGVVTEGDWQALSGAMADSMKITATTAVDMVRIDPNQPTSIMQALLKTTPFYTRPER
jgi:hypothetical protein